MLISYLGKMRIEVELSLATLGICENEKLKLYISPRSKMGIKAEIHLIVTYNQAKDRIIKEVQQVLQQIEAGMPLQTSSSPIQLDTSLHFPSPIPQQLPSYRNVSRMQPPSCQLRKTRSFRESS